MFKLLALCLIFVASADDRVPVVVPVRGTHFAWAATMRATMDAFSADTFRLVFIFSSEAAMLESGLDCSRDCMVAEYTNLNPRNHVTFKKFWALREMCMLGHEYVIAPDADAVFTRPATRLLESLREQDAERAIWASYLGHNEYRATIQRNAGGWLEGMRKDEWDRAVAGLYSWWNVIPSFRCSHMTHFLEVVGFPNRVETFGFENFDHIVYQSYLYSYQNFSIRTTPGRGVCNYVETMCSCSREEIKEFTDVVRPLWLPLCTALQVPLDSYGFMRFHADRGPEARTALDQLLKNITYVGPLP